jgi:GcrA cell cycle regulator
MKTQAKPQKKKALLDLEARDCRWPIGDPKQDGFHFCGAQRTGDRPYCVEHWALSFIPNIRTRSQTSQPKPAPVALPVRRAA